MLDRFTNIWGVSCFLDAVAGNRPSTTPVWFMRQAGRSLPEYRAIREKYSMMEACLTPELAAEITLQPVRRHKVDAAIFFSDIIIPLRILGIEVDIAPGVGPVFAQPARSAEQIKELSKLTLDEAPQITEAVKLCVAELGDTPLIGFAGAPFTLAAYLVEGRPSRDHLTARALMHADPDSWHIMMGWLADVTNSFLKIQLAAGAKVVQLFDSWTGSLSRDDYAKYVLPYSRRAVAGINAPVIHFGTGTYHLLDLMASIADVIGVDHRISLDAAIKVTGPMPVQGNIDPAMLSTPWPVLQEHIDNVLAAGQAAPSHIVNLGHGVPANTDPDVLTRIVSYIKER